MLFCPIEIGTVTRVNLDDFAFVDEEWNANLGACFELGGLGCVGCSVAFETGLGVDYFEIGFDGHLGKEDGVGGCVTDYLDDVAFFHVVDSCDECFLNGHVVPGFLVEEVVGFTFGVRELIGPALYADVFELFADVEATFTDKARDNVLELGAHEGIALARLNMEELNTEEEFAVKANARSVFDVLRIDHRLGWFVSCFRAQR